MSRLPLLNSRSLKSYTTANNEAATKDETLDVDDSNISSQDDLMLTSTIGYIPDLKWTVDEEDAVRNIIDKRLMSFVLLMTFVLNMDRTNISNAISDGLPADLGFDIDGVNRGSMVYAFIFTIFTLPSNVIVKRVGANNWIPLIMSSWGIVTWAHVFITDFKGYLIVRILIAATEAGFIPACLTYLTGFYKTNELATRLAWFWGIQAFASAFSGLLSFGIFRMAGVADLPGWKWLFLLDGVATDIVGFIAFLYLPASLTIPNKLSNGKIPWFTEREMQIAVTRLIRDDQTKNEQYRHITLEDVKLTVFDTRLWTHLLITFIGLMPNGPINTYLPTMIKQSGFSVYMANLLAAPTYLVNLVFAILIARAADRYGNTSLFALIGVAWNLTGFLLLEFLPENAGKWAIYSAAFVAASSPSWHGMQIAWMASNLAPIGKRTLALGAVIGAANICGVPGSQIYKAYDAPRFYHGNKILIGLCLATIILFLGQRTRYVLTNKYREKKWNSMTRKQRQDYDLTTSEKGNDRLDFRFRL
ncbi:major facilitator superfamily domain-containing protein [Umbelopsis sp. PMI_123]|nr:major facilitator superfamily domain-containing protein [Umbelopsis sp. PMI_123]